MKRMKRLWVYSILFILLFTFAITSLYLSQTPKKDKIVPCYDRYGNEIINQKCIIQVPDNPDALVYILFSVVFLVVGIYFEFAWVTTLWEDKIK